MWRRQSTTCRVAVNQFREGECERTLMRRWARVWKGGHDLMNEFGLSEKSDKQSTRLVYHWKYEKIVVEIENSWVQNKGVFEISNRNVSKRHMKKPRRGFSKRRSYNYLLNLSITWLVDTKHTCALLKSFAGLWRTSNKYKLCPTKITTLCREHSI